jgi:hypothetical protein
MVLEFTKERKKYNVRWKKRREIKAFSDIKKRALNSSFSSISLKRK